MDRSAGRYNLHKIGWKAFEDLVVEIHRVILGETVTQFRSGADEGRDAFYQGRVKGEYDQVSVGSKLVIQCKHSANPGESFVWSDVSDELEKVRALKAAGEVDLYIVATNKRLSAPTERNVRERFEEIDGLKCRVLGEEWIESTIDGEFRLLRRVPRLYGVGNLSQILATSVAEQTQFVLEEMSDELAVFVPTPAFRMAVDAMENHGLVFVVGPPASGKSAIATNLCVVLGAEDPEVEVLRIETAKQFAEMWTPRDSKKLFWIEDVFGETRFDRVRAEEWQRIFVKVLAARKAGSRFIFTCRDYILNESHNVIRKSLMDQFESRTIFVKTSELTSSDRHRILYNHIKFGDLPSTLRANLKPHLPVVAEASGFTPELARRLGTHRFHRALNSYDKESILRFVQEPLHFFEEVIHDLSKPQQAAIALLLLTGNGLPDPVADIPPSLENAYAVSIAEVRDALRSMKGSLTRLAIVGSEREWRVHHPTMIDAMHKLLRDDVAMLDLFLEAAPAEILVRDVHTEVRAHTVFVPSSLYKRLGLRLLEVEPVVAIRFILGQSKSFRAAMIKAFPNELADLMRNAVTWRGEFLGHQLLRLFHFEAISFPEGRKALGESLPEIVWKFGWFPDDIAEVSETIDAQYLAQALEAGLTTDVFFENYFDEIRENASDYHEVEEVLSRLEEFPDLVSNAARVLLDAKSAEQLTSVTQQEVQRVAHELDDYIGAWATWEDDAYDRWRDGYYSSPVTESGAVGIFSDVDK